MRYDPRSTVLVARVSAVPGEVFRACTGVCSRPRPRSHRGSKQNPILKNKTLFVFLLLCLRLQSSLRLESRVRAPNGRATTPVVRCLWHACRRYQAKCSARVRVCSRPEAADRTGIEAKTYFCCPSCVVALLFSPPSEHPPPREPTRDTDANHIPTRSSTAKRLPPATRAAVPP